MKALLYKDLCVLWKQMKFVIFFGGPLLRHA